MAAHGTIEHVREVARQLREARRAHAAALLEQAAVAVEGRAETPPPPPGPPAH